MRRAFWMEVRRSPLRWWLPVLVALDVAMLFGRSTWWIGVWPEASAAAQVPAQFFGMILGGGAAWVAGRTRRTSMTEQFAVSVRRRWRIELLMLASTVCYGFAAYTPGLVLAAVVSFPEAGPGFLWPSYLLLGACLILLSASVGHLAGKLFASRIVPPLATAVILFGLQMNGLVSFFVLSGHANLEVSASALVLRLSFALFAAALAVVLPSGRPVVQLSAALTGVLLLTVVASSGPVQVPRTATEQPLCSSGAPKVCVWPEDRKHLDSVRAMVTRLLSLPGGVVRFPDAVYQEGLRARDQQGVGNGFQFLAGDMSVPMYLSGVVLDHTLPDCDIPARNKARYYHEVFSLDAYFQVRAYGDTRALGDGGGPPGVDMKAIVRVAGLPVENQAAWVRERMAAIRGLGVCHG
ncbi:hypothetical protein ACFYY8_12245 [Streptosporangium sp. NPDC001559]|uniref:hypothetical protein n=1 Tax=Streptosporangium sp. NPDC001559 TaxID=3366187 RepID=UPI0036EA14A9